MIGNNLLLLVGENGVLFLISGNDYLNTLFKIRLADYGAAVAHGTQGCLVYDVGQFCAGGTGSHTGDSVEVHILSRLYLFGVHLQNGLTALKVRQLNRHPTVKTAGTGESRIKAFGAVGGSQNDDAGVFLKAIHLSEQLVQGLLTLVVAAVAAGVTLLTDGIYLIDENDAGGLFLGLLKQITDLGGTHAHEHLNKF